MAAGTPRGLDSVRISAFVIGLLLLAAALLAPGGAASPEPAVAKAKKGKRVIVRPKAGQRVHRHPVRVVIKGRDGLFDVKARLNGKRITEAFGRTHKGKRRARISRSHGLRRGRNVLRVKARRRIGQRRRKAKVAFFVGHKRPLAGAGRDRRIVEGERFRLRGQALPYPRKPRVRENRRVRYRWRITRAPRQSELRDEAKARSARLAGRPLGKPTARRPGFTPDVRGQYRFKLRITDGKRSSSDEVRLNAVPGTPFVPIETMLRIPSPAIGVGDELYPAGGGASDDGPGEVVEDPFLQVLVLDRKTLGSVSNKTYGCPGPFHNCAAPVVNDLKKLDDTKLVIAVNHPGYFIGGALPIALAPIGFPKYDPARFNPAPSGTVSAIGVPGLPAGQADISIDLNGPPGIANMDGYLTPNQFFDYTWLPQDRPLYDTRESSGDEGDRNVMEIGGKKIETGMLGAIPAAFQVVVLDGLTLDLVDNHMYFTNAPALGSTTFVNQMRERLRQVTQGQVVFITSLTDTSSRPVGPDAASGAWTSLGSAIADLGGTRHAFFEATARDGASYTLVGWGGAGETNGEESTSVKDTESGGGRLQGALVPDHSSQFRPAVASVGDAPNETLIQLMLKPEGPWPLDGNAEAQSAIKWIGSQIKQLGANPRSAYWIQDGGKEPLAWWRARAADVAGLEYPGRLIPHGFSKANFELAQAELVQEIKWVGTVRDYLGDLASPVSDDALQTFKNLDVISSKVTNALHPPDDKTQAIILDIVRGFFGLVGAAGGPPGEAVAEVFQVGIDILAEEVDGSDINDINVRASQLEAQLEDRLQNVQKSIARIGDIIVADYTKLSTVGTNAKCAPGPNCPVEWQFTGEDQEAAAASMYKGIETLFSEQLMRLAFPAWLLPGPPHNARQWYCEQFVGYLYPFNNTKVNPKQILADTGQAQLIVGNFPNLGFLSQLYALGSGFPNPLSTGKLTVPPASILNRMFSPASSSLDPKDGGLGMYKPDFMVNANPRDWLDYVNSDVCQWQ